MTDANTALLDAALRHEIGIRRLATATIRKLIAILAEGETELVKQIVDRMGWIAARGYNASDFTLQRLEANLVAIRGIEREAYQALGKELRSDLLQLSPYEASFQERLIGNTLSQGGVTLGVISPNRELLRAIVDSRPFQGALLRDWVRSLEFDAFKRLRGAIRQGMLQGETIQQIVRRIRGTRANGFADGILEISRKQAEAVARTAVSHVANTARDETYRANADLVKGVQWVSTLDSRTTDLCASRDGFLYDVNTHRPLDGGPPWEAGPGRLHWNCRSTSVPVLKSWRELGIALEDAPLTTRASMTGQVPASTTYGAWLKRQTAEIQDEVLGKARGQAFRRGEISFDKFFDSRGRFLSLEDLRLREAA